MANKRSRACNQNKKSTAPYRNPDHLPRRLICLMQPPKPWSWWPGGVSDMVVAKSWGSLPRECRNNSFLKTLPLVQSNSVIQPPSHGYPEMNNKGKPFDRCHTLKFMGSSEGSIVGSHGFKFGPSPYGYYFTTRSSHFEDPKSGIHRACIAYYNLISPSNPNTCLNVVLTGISSPTILIQEKKPTSGMGCVNLKWLKYGCNLVDPNDPGQGYMRLCTGIWLGDKFYAVSLQGTLVVLQFGLDHCPLIVALGSGRAVPSSRTSSRHFREYLLEANGQILLVFLLSKKSIKIVDYVEVFGLDVTNLSWVEMWRLGDTTSLFLGPDCCVVVNTSKLDSSCDSSCIYFTNIEFDGWKFYDMKRGCIGEWKFESMV